MSKDPRTRDLAVIHMLRKRALDAGVLDDDGYRVVIGGIMDELGTPGAPSAAALDAAGRSRLILAFGTLGVRLERAPSLAPGHGSPVVGHWRSRYIGSGREGFAGSLSQKQADEIARLEDRLKWSPDPTRLLGFIERQIGRSLHVHELTKAEAVKVITGLRRLDGAPRRERRRYTSPRKPTA